LVANNSRFTLFAAQRQEGYVVLCSNVGYTATNKKAAFLLQETQLFLPSFGANGVANAALEGKTPLESGNLEKRAWKYPSRPLSWLQGFFSPLFPSRDEKKCQRLR
jgi:hypothetical protein